VAEAVVSVTLKAVAQEEMAVQEAAAEVVEMMPVVLQQLDKVMLVVNLNHNLHQLMIEVVVEEAQVPLEVMVQMILELQVMGV
tara:strand:- start:207 stop:455 length:249 start_codon:yes stop_codon:yes gene_type:complete